MTRRRRLSPWVLVFVVVVINLPVVHSAYLGWQLDRSGIDTTATLTSHVEIEGRYGVEFRFGRDIDPGQTLPTYLARVDPDAYEQAVREETVPVRVLADNPAANQVAGQVTSRLPLVITLLTDLVLLAFFLLIGRGRRNGRADGTPGAPGGRDIPLHLVALEDVVRCRPTNNLLRLDDATYLVSGEVCLIDDVGIVLDLGDRQVRVDLAGHANPVGYQQPARVTARLSDLRA